jgi:hypothetical protein
LHSNSSLPQQRAHSAESMGKLSVDDGNLRGDVANISTTALTASSDAGSSSKVVSWLQASEAAFADERALLMQETAYTTHLHSDGSVSGVSADAQAQQHAPRRAAACRIDLERIQMAAGKSLSQPMLLAALRSPSGSLKQVV